MTLAGPRRGFFKPGELKDFRQSLTVVREPQCGACGLFKGCLSPKMPVTGSGARKILIVGEAPGENEDVQNRSFVGKSGEMLTTKLRHSGVGLFQDCWVTNALRCRPKNNKLPKDPGKLISYCRPLLLRAITELKPEVIILLGKIPVQSLIGWLWKEDVGAIGRWVGHRIPSMRLNAWICPTFHPSFVLRGQRKGQTDVAESLLQTHLDHACNLQGRPYPHGVPNYEKLVKRCHDPDEACDYLHRMIDACRTVALDYETDRLKPDSRRARIVSCAVSDGTVSVAFPWHGRVVEVFKELITSPRIPKVGWNAKFEQRWTMKALGCEVNNWLLDGMLGAHVLDTRKGTKGLKFRSFVHLGMDSYNDEVEPYLKPESGGSNDENRLSQVSVDRLLLYNGLDALLEYKLAEIIAPRVGVEL